MIDLEQMKKIDKIIDETCASAMSRMAIIAPEDQELIQKYVDLGAITYKKPPRGWLQREIYFPTLTNPEMDGLCGEVWLKLLRKAIEKYNVPSNIGPNSVAEYINKAYQYGMDQYTAVQTNNWVGRAEVGRQLDLMHQLDNE